MTSAFEPPSVVPRYVVTTLQTEKAPVPRSNNPLESETEDEEVKLNCIGGFRGCDDDSDDDSDDMNTTNYSDDSDDDMDRRVGVVNFVARLKPSPRLIRPSASRHPTLSPPLELDEEDEDEDEYAPEEDSEVGARGVALEFDDDSDEEADPEADDSSTDSGSEMEHESVSGSDADESDMEEDDEEEQDEEDETEVPSEHPEPTLERPTLQDTYTQEEETASVILQALEEEDDEEISSLIDSVQGREISPLEPLMADEDAMHRSDTHLIGVAQDRQDHLGTVPRVKRVLSLDETMLSERNLLPAQEVVLKKRRRSDSHQDLRELASFSLGPPAMTLLPEPTPPPMVEMSRFLNPIISSSEELEDDNEVPLEDDDEEEELDGQLRYELQSTTSSGGDQSPVPLLTPPESPVLGVETCEWPSNLVVDSAMTAVLTTQIRPLDAWSEVEDETSFTKGTPSLLTPLMRGIQVCDP